MLIWHRGSAAVSRGAWDRRRLPVPDFLADLKTRGVPRVPGTAVFLTRTASGVPPVMIWHLRHNRALHECVVVVSVSDRFASPRAWPASG